MKTHFIFFWGLFITFLGIFGYKTVYGLFFDTANSTTNTFAAAAVFPTATPTPIPVGIATHLVISEVQITGGSGDADHDFIELYNPTNSAIDLNGHRLVKRTGNSGTDS